MDENVDEKLQSMNLFMNVGNKIFFAKIELKKHDGRNLIWFIYKKSLHEMLKS
jgi:hypothetical protein